MTDYGRPVAFGIFPTPNAADLDQIWQAVDVADREGLDLIGVQDHPYQRRFLDTLSLLSGVAARTQHVTVFPDVACLPLRPPAVLAKAAVSIDLMSNGRFELGLGAGGFWEAIEALGGPRRTPAQALGALREAMDVIRLMWSDQRSVRYEGEHYRLSGVKPGPAPAHEIAIWLGVYGPKALRLLGERADGWIPSIPRMSVEDLDAKQEVIDRAALAAGRQPRDIRRLANVNGVVTEGESRGFLQGPPDQWVEELTGLALEHGIDGFILWPDGDLVEQTGRFASVAARARRSIEVARSPDRHPAPRNRNGA